MRSLWLAIGLVFVAPAEAGVLPACCVIEGGQPDIEDPPDLFVRAVTRRPGERAFEETAEAPVAVDVPLLVARPIEVEEPREPIDTVPAPVAVRTPAFDSMSPCCRLPAGEPDVEEPLPFLVPANTRRPAERELVESAEAPEPPETQLASAIAAPIEAPQVTSLPALVPVALEPTPSQLQSAEIDGPPCCTSPGANEPDYAPTVGADGPQRLLRALYANAEAIVVVFVLLLAIGIGVNRRQRRRRLELEPLPPSRPVPNELPIPDMAPVPVFEPEIAPAAKSGVVRELEPA